VCTLGPGEGSSKWSSESGLGPSHCVRSTRRVLLLLLSLALPRASLYSAESCSASTPRTTTPSTATWPTPPPPPSSRRTSKPGLTGPRRFRAPKASGSATPRLAPSLSTSQTSLRPQEGRIRAQAKAVLDRPRGPRHAQHGPVPPHQEQSLGTRWSKTAV
jgi:hypothetical protein